MPSEGRVQPDRFDWVFTCTKGHRITVPESEGERTNLTPCPKCQKPLFVKGVRHR